MTELAHLVEADERYAFDRVDVFNSGASPIFRGYNSLKTTILRAHRTRGDLVSKFFEGPGKTYEHPERPEFCSHSLKHFLPEKMPQNFTKVMTDAQAWVEGCCGGTRQISEAEIQHLQEQEASNWTDKFLSEGDESEGSQGDDEDQQLRGQVRELAGKPQECAVLGDVGLEARSKGG